MTAADGSYSFTNLGPGSYTVQEVVPAGSTQTAGNAGYTVIATSGSNSSGNNFANFANITISGTKYNDITGNSFSGDDTGLGGVTINLYLNGGSTPVASTVTAADGSYSFSNLGPGSYTVQEVVPAGSTQTGGNAGYTISATSGTNSSGNNFDNFANISISGTKYNDNTGNGITGDDTGLGGVTINLYLNGGSTPVASTVTAADGSYSFTNLGPGSLHGAGSRSGRFDANRRQCWLHGQRHERLEFVGQRFRQLREHHDQRHQVQRHHRQ